MFAGSDKLLLLLILGMARDQLSEEETVEYLSRVFTIEEIEESESALNFAEQLTEEHKDKMRDFFNKVKQQIQKNDLVAELKHNDDVYAECRKMDAINTAAVCENMTKLQNELQKKGGNNEND